MACDPNQLMADAKCLDCALQGMEGPVMISLLCAIRDLLAAGAVITLPDGQILVGNASNVAMPVVMSKDATIADTGAVTLTNNATARSDIGLGTTDSPQFSGLGLGTAASIAGSLVTATSIIAGTFFRGNETLLGAGVNLDWSLGDYFSKTISAATVFTFSNTGLSRTIVVAVTGDASHTVTWPAVKWAGGVAPVQTLSKLDMYTFIQMSDGNIYGSVVQNMS